MNNVVPLTPKLYASTPVALTSDEGYELAISGTLEGSIDFSVVTAVGNVTYVLTPDDAHRIIAALHEVCDDIQTNCMFDRDPRLCDRGIWEQR